MILPIVFLSGSCRDHEMSKVGLDLRPSAYIPGGR
jgi:hypothetical protein